MGVGKRVREGLHPLARTLDRDDVYRSCFRLLLAVGKTCNYYLQPILLGHKPLPLKA